MTTSDISVNSDDAIFTNIGQEITSVNSDDAKSSQSLNSTFLSKTNSNSMLNLSIESSNEIFQNQESSNSNSNNSILA